MPLGRHVQGAFFWRRFLLRASDSRPKSKNPNPTFLLSQELTNSEVKLGTPPSDSGLSGYLLNTGTKPIRVEIRVDPVGKRPADAREGIRRTVAMPLDVLTRVYSVPRLSVRVKPCGEINAYSTPDITVCTELLADLFDKGKDEAIIPCSRTRSTKRRFSSRKS